MKRINWLALAFLVFLFSYVANAQVTNVKVNGFSSNFTMVQGDSLKWVYNLPVGGTAECEIWIDLNGNGIIDQASDKQLFGTFTQTDGISNENNGPGDMDGLANGKCLFAMGNFGLAPAKYILKFTNAGVGQSITGTVTAMPSPAFTVSGKITPPPGINAQNILVQTGGDNGPGWMALTDVSGNYIINFNASVSGQQVTIIVADKFPPYVFTPSDASLTLSRSYTGVNFTYTSPAAQLVGYLKGDNGLALANVTVNANPQYGGTQYGGKDKSATTDANGFFRFGFALSEIASSPIWSLQTNSDGIAPTYFPPRVGAISLHQYDSLRVDMIAYVADDSITGKVTVNGHAPGGISFSLYTYAQDNGQTNANTDPNTGNFTLHVTRKYSNYQLGIDNLPQNYGYDQNIPQTQPGAKNVLINVGTLAWLPQTSNTYNSLKAVSFVNSTTGWVAGSNGTMLRTTNAGVSWSSQTANTTNNINGIDFLNASMGWLVGDGGIIKNTTNGGGNWTSQNSTTAENLQAVQFIDANSGWAVGGSGQGIILKTTNGGTTWTSQNPGYGQLYSLAMVSSSIGWVVGSGAIFKTTNGGTSWISQLNPTNMLYSVLFADAYLGVAVGGYGNTYSTTDGGTNWTPRPNNSGNFRCMSGINSSTLWVVGDNGNIYRTTNGGSTWTKQLTNINNNNLNAVQFVDANNGWAVGDNGTILRTTSGGTATSVWENRSHEIPSGFSMYQNYPNPFNPSTTISYGLPARSRVHLVVFNLLGQIVAELFNGDQDAGWNQLSWNANVSSGLYFYRLEATSVSDPSKRFVDVKKMLLLR